MTFSMKDGSVGREMLMPFPHLVYPFRPPCWSYDLCTCLVDCFVSRLNKMLSRIFQLFDVYPRQGMFLLPDHDVNLTTSGILFLTFVFYLL
jgi:hypothetical protein